MKVLRGLIEVPVVLVMLAGLALVTISSAAMRRLR